MTENDLIERLAAAVAEHMKRTIPLSVDLWDIAMIAEYMKRSPAVVRERIVCVPSFPKAIRLPTTRGRTWPLYRAIEVIKWTDNYRDKN